MATRVVEKTELGEVRGMGDPCITAQLLLVQGQASAPSFSTRPALSD